MKEIGYKHGGANDAPETLFDGKVFDAAKAEVLRDVLRRPLEKGLGHDHQARPRSLRRAASDRWAECAARPVERQQPHLVEEPSFAHEDLGDEQGLRGRASRKRGEMDQGVLRFAWYSLVLVTKGFSLAILVGTPLGFLLGLSPLFDRSFGPIIQILRPVSRSPGCRWARPVRETPPRLPCSPSRYCGHVADGPQYSHGCTRHPAGRAQRRSRTAAAAADAPAQDPDPCDPALHVHGLSLEPSVSPGWSSSPSRC